MKSSKHEPFLPVIILFGLLLWSAVACSSSNVPISTLVNYTPTPKESETATSTTIPPPWLTGKGIPLPPKNHLYHGVFPSGGDADVITIQALMDYEAAVGKQAAWVYFSHFWFEGKEFPLETALWIREAGSIPYLRLMMQSFFKSQGDEPLYTLQNIIEGQFDPDLRAWCQSARGFGTPVIAEYGVEVNSDSFPWSGIFNGGGETDNYGDTALPDGPERFQDAYRHIIQLCRQVGADNITWVFHADSWSYPNEAWNQFENYYPGDEWIDWVGFSIYGVHTPYSQYYSIFSERMEDMHPRMLQVAPEKPIIITEVGSAKNNPYLDQVEWTRDALVTITSMRYQNLIGFTWWNEAWQNDGNPENDTTMRVQDNPQLQTLFREMIGNNSAILGQISR